LRKLNASRAIIASLVAGTAAVFGVVDAAAAAAPERSTVYVSEHGVLYFAAADGANNVRVYGNSNGSGLVTITDDQMAMKVIDRELGLEKCVELTWFTIRCSGVYRAIDVSLADGDDRLLVQTTSVRVVAGGGNGNDQMTASATSDEVFFVGDGGDDILRGGPKDDWLWGRAGSDTLFGFAGSDSLLADAGTNQKIHGGTGQDSCTGDNVVVRSSCEAGL
jgi:Ca2+-binding RTX toxin-like protein